MPLVAIAAVWACNPNDTPSILNPFSPLPPDPSASTQPAADDDEAGPPLPKDLAEFFAINPIHHRINCGGPDYTDPDGNLWVRDAGFYNTGKIFSTSQAIAATDSDPLYQVERYDTASGAEMMYTIPVPAGQYRVRLHFSENYPPNGQPGRRLFHVLLEGGTVLDDFDIFASAGQLYTAIVREFTSTVSDGSLNIEFRHVVENPKINAIEVEALDIGEPPQITNGAAAAISVALNSRCTASPNQIMLTATDPDSPLTQLQWSIAAAPAHGAANFVGQSNGGQITLCYAPDPFQLSADSFSAIVADPQGGTDTIQINVSVTGVLPSLAITQPAANQTIAGDVVTLGWAASGDMTGIARVRMRLDNGTPVESGQLSGTHVFTNVTAGAHVANAQLIDNGGDPVPLAQASATVNFETQVIGQGPPAVAVLSPAPGALITGNDVSVQWTTSGDLAGVDHVHLRMDSGPHVSVHDLSGAYTFNGVAAGPHTLTVQLAGADHTVLQNPEATAVVSFQVQTLVPSMALSPSSVDFGFVPVGTTSASITVTLQNTGETALTVESLDLSGPNASEFVLSGPALPFNVPIGSPQSVSLFFSAAADGARTATLSVDAAELASPVTAALVGTGFTPSSGGQTLYRVNCGGPSYVDPTGNTWTPDAGYYNVGKLFSTTADISGTELDPLYRTERYDTPANPEMMYSFTVASGTYRVRLHVAETYSPMFYVGRRIFDVKAEGVTAVDNLDIFAEAGANAALIKIFDVAVSDGTLNLQFIHGVENPKINAIEIIELTGGPELHALPDRIEWGHVALGQTGDIRNVQLFNPGTQPAVITSLSFRINAGAGHEFRATLGGTEYVGDHDDVTFPVSVTVGPGQSLMVPTLFAPSENGTHDVTLEFDGNFPTQAVQLVGVGGENPGHPFLHVVIDIPPVTVDYDQNGVETIALVGDDSHTHELGHTLTTFEWREAGQIFSTVVNPTLPFAVGDHTVSLTIRDDNQPPESLTDFATFKVVGPNAIPGNLVLYYPGGAGGAAALLDNVPSNATFAEITSTATVHSNGGLVGASPFGGNVMVRFLAQVDILVADSYTFIASGGTGRRLYLDGALVTGAQVLTAGRHTFEARFAVSSSSELPLLLTYARGGGPQADIPATLLTHDQTAIRPVINTMPSAGAPQGGEMIQIGGLGFFPQSAVVVRWGSQTISGAALTVSPTSVRFAAPPGAGTITVTVETPNGPSNAVQYVYNSGGPAPIVFTLSDLATGISGPTTADWGADGRLYVGTINGQIRAYTLDDNYNVTATQIINTLAGLTNKNILGIAANPLDAPGAVRLYVAHSLIYANGGSCFTGTSPYSGQISVLTGPNFDVIQPLITNLPVSNHDHAINGMAFDNNGDLYIAIGGNTNAGVEHCNLGALPESPFTACVLKAEVSKPNFNGQISYRMTAGGQANLDQVFGGGVDPVHGLDLAVFAHGLRNPYDVVFSTRGLIYGTDNGPNGGFGAASTSATTQGPDPTAGDELNLLEQNHYYGHPNRNRGRYDDRQNVYRGSAAAAIPGVFTQMITNFAASTNGITEYRANTFNGAMRGDLLAQKWNDVTYRVTLSANGKTVMTKQNLTPAIGSLDIVTGPGGVIIGIDYTNNKLKIARPQHTPGLAVYDIFPWRAPQSGGQPFVIAGNGFGTLANTTVSIGGVPANLTTVTATRIRGTVPARPGAPATLLDVVVNSSGNITTLPAAFQYLSKPAGSATTAEAYVIADAGGDLDDSSTYAPNSYQIRNDSTAGQRISQVRINLAAGFLRDMVFDPNGTAGDTAFKVFSPNQHGGAGLVGHGYSAARDGGYDELLIDFNDFNPGETFTFSIDVDPTSIQGSPPGGQQDVGAISGLETAGARVTVVFSDGTIQRGDLFQIAGSGTGAETRVRAVLPPAPAVQILGVPMSPATTSIANQTVRVSGPPNSPVRLMIAEAGLYLAGVPGGGFDLDPYEANKLLAVASHTATIGAAGYVDIPVLLTNSGTGAGLNHIVAVIIDAGNRSSSVSNIAIVKLTP